MLKAVDYRRRALECRDLAAKMPTADHRDQLLEMALVWDEMGNEHERFIAEHPQFEAQRSLKG